MADSVPGANGNCGKWPGRRRRSLLFYASCCVPGQQRRPIWYVSQSIKGLLTAVGHDRPNWYCDSGKCRYEPPRDHLFSASLSKSTGRFLCGPKFHRHTGTHRGWHDHSGQTLVFHVSFPCKNVKDFHFLPPPCQTVEWIFLYSPPYVVTTFKFVTDLPRHCRTDVNFVAFCLRNVHSVYLTKHLQDTQVLFSELNGINLNTSS